MPRLTRTYASFSPQVLVAVGRTTLFNYMSTIFDDHNAENDGAFIAEMLAVASVKVGDVWWVHRDTPNCDFLDGDPHRNWEKGLVREINEKERHMKVQLFDLHANFGSFNGSFSGNHFRPKILSAERMHRGKTRKKLGSGSMAGSIRMRVPSSGPTSRQASASTS